jgi:hypothetical protein
MIFLVLQKRYKFFGNNETLLSQLEFIQIVHQHKQLRLLNQQIEKAMEEWDDGFCEL